MIVLTAVLLIIGSKPVNSTFAMWAAGIFGFFGYVWLVMGYIVYQGGDLRPLSSLIIFTSVCCAMWAYESFQLQALSFGALFVTATIGTFLAWIGIRGWWSQGTKWAGACFFILAFIGIYIGLYEMMHNQSVMILLKG